MSDVYYIHSEMRGAPVLNGAAAGYALASVLDAALITGFGATTAVSVSVTDGIATATLPSGESFEPLSMVKVAGADLTAAALQTLRGVMPGLYHTPQLIPAGTFAPWAPIEAQGALSGRRLLAVPGYVATGTTASTTGAYFIDATGPWR